MCRRQEDVCVLYANTLHSYIRDVNILGFWYPRRSEDQSMDTEGRLYVHKCRHWHTHL